MTDKNGPPHPPAHPAHQPTHADIEAAEKIAGPKQWDYVKQWRYDGQQNWTDEVVTPIEVLAWHEDKAIIILGDHAINIPYGEQWNEGSTGSRVFRRLIRVRRA